MELDASKLLATYSELALQHGLDILGALILLVVGWILAGWARRALRRALLRLPRADATVSGVLSNLARYMILVLVIIAVLAQFGMQTASILAVLGTAGLAVGLALQGTLSNIAAGLMLLFLRPFKVGDYIDAEGIAGTVEEIGLFNTEFTTHDGIYRAVPNSQIWSRSILNYSRLPTRRLDLAVGVDYGDDLERALGALSDLLAGDARVLRDPEPQVMVSELADSSVNLNLRCWANTGDFWALKFDLTRQAKERIEAAGCTIPFPQRVVHTAAQD
ncbi:MAG: mechanosensitive ion channel [Rhodospirillales bacterium]|nr:mechanosensitive ion channel [Rhodospirillales bacterium]MDH3913016.1 mechanosensitive ion channel [Rhodospirillales bacterium]MDH3966760.1 mechanosensitive ion channel [Rhodospirillales bacterium]